MISRMTLAAAFSSGAAAAGLEARIQYLTTEKERERAEEGQWVTLSGKLVCRQSCIMCLHTCDYCDCNVLAEQH